MDVIDLEIKSLTVISGQELFGTVNLVICSQNSCKSLVLLLTGREKSYYRKQSRSGKYFKEYHGKVKTARVEIQLAEFDVLEPGEYSFPFTLETPLDLAGSFELSSDKAKGYIEYYLKCMMLDIHMFKLMKAKKKFYVIQALSMASQLTTEFNTPVSTCSCIHRGHCVTVIEIAKECFSTEEDCEITVTVDNNFAKVDINSFECILWMVCRLKSDTKQVHYLRKCVYLYQHKEAIKYLEEDKKSIPMKFRIKHKDLDLKLCQVTIGKIVQCSYSLQISLEYGTIIYEEPDIQMPIYISLRENSSNPFEVKNIKRLTRTDYE